MRFADALLLVWDANAGYAQRLLANLPADKFVSRAVPESMSGGLLPNHPAWVLSHLQIYHPVLVAALTGQPFPDPKDHRHGMASKPTLDPGQYLPKDELLALFLQGHAQVREAVSNMDERLLDAPPALERWKSRFANQGIWLNYLMVYHESFHLGQISMWRRVQGMPSV